MLNTQNSKIVLAKLLATENITVQYQKVETASFNVGTRTLTMPIIDDITDDVQDLFIGHEVGHALFTPSEYGTVQEGMPRGFGTFLNVVEDARIERDIKVRYPGLKRSFSKGYAEFMRQDFFKVRGKDLSRLLLIDRINLHFKIGAYCNIEFTTEESVLVRKVENCQNFDDVVAVANELFEYCKQELEDKKQEDRQEFESDNFGFDDFGDDEDDYGQGLDGDEEDGEGASQKSSRSDSDDSDIDDGSILSSEIESYDNEVKSVTDEKLQESLRQMAASDKTITVGNLSSTENLDYNRMIVSYKDLIGNVLIENDTLLRILKSYSKENLINAFGEFESRNKNAIQYLVKEFELRKKAAENRRIVVSDTGVLDTNKLHTYKFNDDIFRKIGSVSAGKNHGVVIFLDWSGSMTDNMLGTIEQVLTLVSFCQKIKVPYEVYAFSTEYEKHKDSPTTYVPTIDAPTEKNSVIFTDRFTLLNLFSSKMKTQEFRKMARDLLIYAKFCGTHMGYTLSNPIMRLGGTPLNSTIFAASGIVNRFRKAYKSEIVNVIFLTDGEDTSNLPISDDSSAAMTKWHYRNVSEPTPYSTSYIYDTETKKRYKIGSLGVTPTLLQILKDRTGCNLIGFYIVDKAKRNFISAYGRLSSDADALGSYTKFRENKFFGILNYGYDEYFLIPGGSSLVTDDEDLDDILGDGAVGASARKLRGAFLKMNRNRLTNRVLLSKTIERIA